MQVPQPVQPECQQRGDGFGHLPDQCAAPSYPGHQPPLTPPMLSLTPQSGTVISNKIKIINDAIGTVKG